MAPSTAASSTARPSAHASLIPALLDEYGAEVRKCLATYFARSGGGGGVYEMAQDYPGRGGRMLRPSLCVAAARAFGARTDEAVHTAASLELLHNAFLVHDDVEDDGEVRRGRPTLHRLHGVPTAINVGDALVVMSLRPLMTNQQLLGPRMAMRILEETERMARESVEGQGIELAWRRDNRMNLQPEDYLVMVLKKTCWYTTIFPCRVGALIGSRDAVDLDGFIRFGFFLGASFQIQDDLLNLVGNEQKYGKELDGDIFEGKRTVPLIHTINQASPDERQRLSRALAAPRPERRGEDVAWIRELMDRHGSIEYARDLAHGLAGAAQREFYAAFGACPPSTDKAFLEALAGWMLSRA